MNIMICVACHNRRRIAEQCLPTIRDGAIYGEDLIVLYNDGSAEFDAEWLRQFGDVVVDVRPAIGIEAQRRRHFEDFWKADTVFSHLYLTDHDAPHDPNWRSELLRLQEKYNGAPICGYNTQSHARIPGNTIEDDPASEVIWRRVAPGISYLLTREHVGKIVATLPHLPAHWNWDWTVPAILGNRFAVTRTSLVSHCGHGGYHHPPDEGYDGGDHALNPTSFLIEKRAAVVKALIDGPH